MTNPIQFSPLAQPGAQSLGSKRPSSEDAVTNPGEDFASAFRAQLDKVNRMQSEADEQVKLLVSGETSSVTDVFTAARKAQVAFSMLMEIRNKLVDAYNELQNMRV